MFLLLSRVPRDVAEGSPRGRSAEINDRFLLFSGSSNGHSPVLNLSKTAGSGSVGEQSGSEAEASHRSQDDEEEDDNLSEDLDDDNEKDEGEIRAEYASILGVDTATGTD